ncbi:hypothetical protein LMH73_011700 [Vibrio splendidus]|nr:hypothetical protein [Vibrio splendidus]MCC4883021.1 hypothetical protein [Vibrio splendidus]
MMKKTILALAVMLSLPVSAHDTRPDIQNPMFCDIEIDEPTEHGIWNDAHRPYDCETPMPASSSVKLDQLFEQSTMCAQNRERLVTARTKNLTTKVITIVGTAIESDVYIKSITSIHRGTKNYKVSERIGEPTMMKPIGEHYDCETIPDGVQKIGDHHSIVRFNNPLNLEFIARSGNEFTMSKTCTQDYERTRQVYDVMADGSEVPNRLLNEVVTRKDAFESTYNLSDGVYSEVDTFVSVRVDRSQGEGRNFYLLKLVIAGDELFTIEDKSYSSKGILEQLEKRGYTIDAVNYRVDNNYFPAATSTYKMSIKALR